MSTLSSLESAVCDVKIVSQSSTWRANGAFGTRHCKECEGHTRELLVLSRTRLAVGANKAKQSQNQNRLRTSERTHQRAQHFKASLELGGIVRGRDLVFLSSTTETAHLLRDSSGSRDCAFFKSILVPRERKRSCLHCCCLLLTEGEKVLGFLQQLAGVCPRDNQLLDIGQLIQ
jgi:hypothetical protein